MMKIINLSETDSIINQYLAELRDAGYQNQPEHANFKQLLEMPQEDAQNIMEGGRFGED